ncbi:MAG: hypothetical protein JJLCMIEE_02068 [Acidimicrobiales bacterium]|nr:MAG: hypothetical protein EDR02_03130 [Actinomycetota bacterium]MBV6509001.1 hypothetical protein [Acidimicrobiales bacterium]RIK06285.1 MAG: hypothetical protein DCC48_07615 [Acidobacteriota bacterium]
MLRVVVYGDFNCPYSCLASSRVDVLLNAGSAQVEWRAVEHDLTIPATGQAVSGDLEVTLDREITEIRSLLRPGERFPIRRPPLRPNTRSAILAFAAAAPEHSDELRRALFAALWFDGRDTGARTVLDELGAPVTDHDPAGVAGAWRDAWLGLERVLVPMLVLPDGYVSRGLGALARLADLADLAPPSRDPA